MQIARLTDGALVRKSLIGRKIPETSGSGPKAGRDRYVISLRTGGFDGWRVIPLSSISSRHSG